MKNKINTLLAFVSVILAFSACKKVELAKSMGDRGQTIVKLLTPGYILSAIDVKSTTQAVCVAELRRDVPNESELNKPLTVTVYLDTAGLKTYNIENQASYVLLPSSQYSVGTDVTMVDAYTFTVTFQPGEFAKCLSLNLPNTSTLDLNKQYAFPITLQTTTTTNVRTAFEARSAFVEIAPKNKYDGKYKVTGTYSDVSSTAFSALYPYVWDVVTISASSNRVDDLPNLGGPGFLFSNAGALTYYGEYGLQINFDPATDKIASVVNTAGQPSPTRLRAAVLDPTGLNRFNPADHSIDIKYMMTQNGAPKAFFDQHFEYIGPR
jgi:hypothetical protein